MRSKTKLLQYSPLHLNPVTNPFIDVPFIHPLRTLYWQALATSRGQAWLQLRPASLRRVSTKVCSGLNVFLCFGDHVIRFCSGDDWSYTNVRQVWVCIYKCYLKVWWYYHICRCLFVILFYQSMFLTFLNILLYVWSNLLSSTSVKGQGYVWVVREI